MATADDYISTVLRTMPDTMATREQIAAELRSHIAERIAHGHSVDDVLRQLGDPTKLANSYLSAEPLVSAPFGARAIAKIVDAAAVMVVVCPLAWLCWRLAPDGFGPVAALAIVFGGGAVLFGIYTMVAEYRRGRTIGKWMEGIRVVTETGARISLGQAVVRTLPMFLQFYWVDVLFAVFTEKNQRAFELLSKTRVVRT